MELRPTSYLTGRDGYRNPVTGSGAKLLQTVVFINSDVINSVFGNREFLSVGVVSCVRGGAALTDTLLQRRHTQLLLLVTITEKTKLIKRDYTLLELMLTMLVIQCKFACEEGHEQFVETFSKKFTSSLNVSTVYGSYRASMTSPLCNTSEQSYYYCLIT